MFLVSGLAVVFAILAAVGVGAILPTVWCITETLLLLPVAGGMWLSKWLYDRPGVLWAIPSSLVFLASFVVGLLSPIISLGVMIAVALS